MSAEVARTSGVVDIGPAFRRATAHGGAAAGAGWQRRYVRTAASVDAGVALLAAVTALLVRFGDEGVHVPGYLVASLLFPLAWVAMVALCRAYETRFLFVGADEYHRILIAGTALIAGGAVASYAAHVDPARGYVAVVLPLVTSADLLGRYALRKRLHRARRRGRFLRRVVVVGYERGIANLCRQLRREHFHGMEVVGACLPPHRPHGRRIEDVDVEVLGTFDDVATAVREAEADCVAVLACPEMDAAVLRRLAWRLEASRTDLLVAPAVMDVAGGRTTIRPVDGLPLLHVEHPELSGGRRIVKALFDRVCAALALLVLSPLLLAIGVAVRATSPGPALFRQVRVGKNGRTFLLYKFRTMHADAEARLAQLVQRNESDGVLFKIRADPRITRLGARLRRYSLDELPQLVNVMLGQMSLVGPRPPLP